MKSDFLVVCLNPTIQKTILLEQLKENEVNRSAEYRIDAAGKGVNTARVLIQLGAGAIHLTQSGDRSEYLSSLIKSDNIALVTARNSSYLRTCTTLIDRSSRKVTEIVEESPPVDQGTEKEILKLYRQLLEETGTVILAGSKARGFSDSVFPEMTRLAREKGRRIILDFRGADLINSIPYKPDFIKINFPEFVSTFFPGTPVSEHEENMELKTAAAEKMKKLFSESGITTVLTRGSLPVIYINESGDLKEKEVHQLIPVNPIGSGDAFTAGFIYKIGRGGTTEEAVLSGIECGAKNAGLLKPGVIK